MTRMSDNPAPSLLLIEQGAAPGQGATGSYPGIAASGQRLYFNTSDHRLYRQDASGNINRVEWGEDVPYNSLLLQAGDVPPTGATGSYPGIPSGMVRLFLRASDNGFCVEDSGGTITVLAVLTEAEMKFYLQGSEQSQHSGLDISNRAGITVLASTSTTPDFFSYQLFSSFGVTSLITGPMAVAVENQEEGLALDASAGDITVTLPDVNVTDWGWPYRFLRVDGSSNNVIIQAAEGQLINGRGGSLRLLGPWSGVKLVRVDDIWVIIGAGRDDSLLRPHGSRYPWTPRADGSLYGEDSSLPSGMTADSGLTLDWTHPLGMLRVTVPQDSTPRAIKSAVAEGSVQYAVARIRKSRSGGAKTVGLGFSEDGTLTHFCGIVLDDGDVGLPYADGAENGNLGGQPGPLHISDWVWLYVESSGTVCKAAVSHDGLTWDVGPTLTVTTAATYVVLGVNLGADSVPVQYPVWLDFLATGQSALSLW